MKNKLLITLLLAFTSFTHTIYSQAPDWLWAKSAGGADYDYAQAISTDAKGNCFVTGPFDSPSLTFSTTILTNIGKSDIFIVKYNAAGNVLWAKSAGGTTNDVAKCISTDVEGNVLVTGYFYSRSLTFGTTTLTNKSDEGYSDIFIAKYDSAGNLLWAKSEGGTSHDIGIGISTDAKGNVLVAGHFMSASLSFGTTTLINKSGFASNSDILIMKYDAAGNELWAKSAGGNATDVGRAISADVSGNVVVTGYFESPSITFGSHTLSNAGGNDIFVVKFDASGKVLWAKAIGGTSEDFGCGISTDPSANVLVTGSYYSGLLNFGTTTLTNRGHTDIFVVKYDDSGNILWAKSEGGNSVDRGRGICLDSSGNVFISGFSSSSLLAFGTITLTNASEAVIFTVKYDVKGKVLWAKLTEAALDDIDQSICADANGNVLITGSFDNPSITFGRTTLSNRGSNDIFVAKLAASPLSIAEKQTNITASIYPNPFNTSSNIEIKTPISNGQLNVYNTHGQLVKEMKNIAGRTVTLLRDNLPNGLYFLSLSEDHKEIVSEKLIITD